MAMTLSEKIADAEMKYHEVATGQSPRVVVDQNGERVEYTPANMTRLFNYLQSLYRLRDGAGSHCRKPAGVVFG